MPNADSGDSKRNLSEEVYNYTHSEKPTFLGKLRFLSIVGIRDFLSKRKEGLTQSDIEDANKLLKALKEDPKD